MSGNPKDNGTFIAGGDDSSSIVEFAGRSTGIFTRGSFTSVGQQGIFSCNGTDSVATSNSDSSRTAGSIMTEGSGSTSTFAVKGSVIGWISGPGSCSTLGSL